MSDLVAFLRARLDEDEEVARATRKNEQFVDGTDRWFASHGNAITSMAPHRAITEVEVKRMLIDELIEGVDEAFGEGSIDYNLRYRGPSTSIDEETGEQEEIPEWNVTRQLRLFALPYGAHPDYREEWRP